MEGNMKLLVFEIAKKGVEGCKERGPVVRVRHQKDGPCSSTLIRCCACPGQRTRFCINLVLRRWGSGRGLLIKCILKDEQYCAERFCKTCSGSDNLRMIWVGDNIQTGVLNGGLGGAPVRSDSGRVWQVDFLGAGNKTPGLATLSLSWWLNLHYRKHWLRYEFEKSVLVLE